MTIAIPSAVLAPLAGRYRAGATPYLTERPEGNLDWLMIYTRRGEGICEPSGETITLVPGDLILIEPKSAHAYGLSPLDRWDFCYVHFLARSDWNFIVKTMPEIFPGHRLWKVPLVVRPVVVKIFTELIVHSARHTSYGDLAAMQLIERLLLLIYKCAAPLAEPKVDSRILRVTQYIEEHLSLPLHLDDLAALSGVSKYRLAHLFTLQVGETPHRFVMSLRMKRACQLLNTTTLTMGEIAYQTGFSSPAHFSQQFTRRMLCSPGKYRASGAPLKWVPN